MKNKKISFVVLSYNQEKLIEKIVNSIIFSGINKNEYEIIILDDGSKKSSSLYLQNFISNISYDIRLIKFDCNTRNQSMLRNIGIAISKYRYIMFADGDDYYNSIDLYNLYNDIQFNDFDIYLSSMIHFDKINKNIFTTKIDLTISDDSEIDHGTQSYVISKDFIIKNNLWFDEIKYNYDSEDMYFTYIVLDKAKNIVHSKNSNFHYVHFLYKGNNTYEKYNNIEFFNYLYELYVDIKNKISNLKIKKLLENYMIKEVERIYKFKNMRYINGDSYEYEK